MIDNSRKKNLCQYFLAIMTTAIVIFLLLECNRLMDQNFLIEVYLKRHEHRIYDSYDYLKHLYVTRQDKFDHIIQHILTKYQPSPYSSSSMALTFEYEDGNMLLNRKEYDGKDEVLVQFLVDLQKVISLGEKNKLVITISAPNVLYDRKTRRMLKRDEAGIDEVRFLVYQHILSGSGPIEAKLIYRVNGKNDRGNQSFITENWQSKTSHRPDLRQN